MLFFFFFPLRGYTSKGGCKNQSTQPSPQNQMQNPHLSLYADCPALPSLAHACLPLLFARPPAIASTYNSWAYTHGFQFFQAPGFHGQNILGTIWVAKRGEHGTCDKDMKIKSYSSWGGWQKQCRNASCRSEASRKLPVDVPPVRHHKKSYITANYLLRSSTAGKTCTEMAALSRGICFTFGQGWMVSVSAQVQPSLQFPGSKSSRLQFLFPLFYTICHPESRAEEPAHFAALLLSMPSSLRQHGLPWDSAASFLSYTAPKKWEPPMEHH